MSQIVNLAKECIDVTRRFLCVAFVIVFAVFSSNTIVLSEDSAMTQGTMVMMLDPSECEDCCNECGVMTVTSCSSGCVASLPTVNDRGERIPARLVEQIAGLTTVSGRGRTLSPDPGPPRNQA